MRGITYHKSGIAVVETCDERLPDMLCLIGNKKISWSKYIDIYLPGWKIDIS